MRIQVVQLKRGLKQDLERLLVGQNRPAAGEPIFELAQGDDGNKLKIGDGIHNYVDLPYIGGGDIVIEDALDGQIIIYNGTTKKWEAKDLADNKSIEYGADGLQIKNFDDTKTNVTPVYIDENQGLKWQQAVSPAALDEKVEAASTSAYEASQYAATAQIESGKATQAAGQAKQFRDATEELIGKKFW